MQDKVTLKIPRELYQRLSHMIEGTGFSSVTEFIVFVMRTLASGGEIRGEDKRRECIEDLYNHFKKLAAV